MARLVAFWLTGLLLSLLAAGGCNVSPQPNPPSVNPGGVEVVSSGMDMVRVSGRMSTVDPAGGRIMVVNLDRMGPVVGGDVSGDGGFAVELPGMPEEHYRLEVTEGELHSRPLDVFGMPGGGGVTPVEPPAECVQVEPRDLLVDLGDVAVGDVGVGQIQLTNACGMEIFIDGVDPGFLSPNLTVNSGAPPIVIPPDQTRTVVVIYTPLEPDEELFDLVFIHVGAPAPVEIPVTVTGHAVAM